MGLFLEPELAVRPVSEFVVTADKCRGVPWDLCKVADFELERCPVASHCLLVKLVSWIAIMLQWEGFYYGELSHHLFGGGLLAEEVLKPITDTRGLTF